MNITVSFLGYKWFVFRTKGNYISEWARCVVVYSGGIALSLALLAPTVFVVGYVTGDPRSAPYIAGALLLGIQVILSFLGHKTFSFKSVPSAENGAKS
jgi:putative flippase GtrA